MDEIDFKNINSIIQDLRRSRDNVKNILEEQSTTIFHSRDYYEGQLDVYETVLDILEIYQKKGE